MSNLFGTYEVFDYILTTEGLTISYTKGAKEMHLILTPKDTCEAFKKVNVIEHFEMDGKQPMIVWEEQEPHVDYYGNFHRRTGMAWMTWADFVKDVKSWMTYNGITMTHIVELHESRKAMDSLFDFIHSIGGTITINQ